MRRYSDTRGRRLSFFEAAGETLVSSKPGAWVFVHVANRIANRIDNRLLPLTKGRFSVSGRRQNVDLLTTTGSKSGQPRTTPLQWVADDDRVLLVASAGGSYALYQARVTRAIPVFILEPSLVTGANG